MTGNIIICGNGHGIECVYRGLIQRNNKFLLCTDDESLKEKASEDGVRIISHYDDGIESEFDIVLTAAYKPKISASDLKKARFVNIHYAMLPKYRGMHAIVWAILNGEDKVGFTLHETSPLLDEGPVIYQEAVLIGEYTSWELMIKIDDLVELRIYDILQDYLNNKLTAMPQNQDEAIFVAPRNLEDCRVLWDSWDTTFFKKALKALVPPYPRPFFEYNSQVIEIVSASVIKRDYFEINGHLVYIDYDLVYVKLSDGLLCLDKIKVDGEEKKAISHFKKIGIRF
ncbi:putative Methionyl-tRNA formyltransferase [Vibrio nigripulchritudo MADA3029]|uniref:formyltransferase family protein n=1 Tax=Vibrio nigripulchritudo TaxID=28173 RepID=UPI0003B1BDF0|nr:formyltransferase family protein [Vibrio nigripulchritudo]CCN47640.1 putative Methionyl-tRNA formyltransferase [Vibrio nigripulchritudo MADA3020]CCN56537.1 putative Methionyl-tRNA formyltransferase [Vibrio nigripulchritudo MADA3021]CCN58839.1 putative Methionyl-tRNA formyltransferase [Vibrio nigripulchritudo MADA3029]